MKDFLRKIPIFADLPEDDLEKLCGKIDEITLEDGEVLFTEGSPGDKAYIIKSGELEVVKESSGREVLLAVRPAGDIIGEMALLEDAPRMASVRARGATALFVIHKAQMDHLLNTSLTAVRSMFFTVLERRRATEGLLRQSEKMAQLGTLTAGVAHELNNPAAAVSRSVDQLDQQISRYGMALVQVRTQDFDAEQSGLLAKLENRITVALGRPAELDALTHSDRVYDIEDWLEDYGVDDLWDYAPALVDLDFDVDSLAELADHFTPHDFKLVMGWLTASYAVHSVIREVHEGAGRITDIVKGLKTYAYLDQAPVQNVDVVEGIESSLVILRGKLQGKIDIKREYASGLPNIVAYGSELNQVWTNIIDNAIDALDGSGQITIRTQLNGRSWVIVEIEDNGPGIPPEIQGKVFDTFFTTKPPGKGTGLGLDICYNIVLKHKGDIKLFSKPGKTCFQVWLPVNFDAIETEKS